jgi:formylglycine-generating enzyme required for sulfatase activity
MDYRGVRAWVRLAPAVAKAYDLNPGDTLHVNVDARALGGNAELCVAFDLHNRIDDAKAGWSQVRGTMSVAKDRRWHRVATTVRVPAFDSAKQWLRPIFGMDATHDRTPGCMEIRDIQLRLDDVGRMKAVSLCVEALPKVGGPLDRMLYDRADFAWAARAFSCHFTFMYDRALYDPVSGAYTLDAFLDDGVREFGGYDIIVLWQAYPRLGVDTRNQFDMYRDMPGGLAGVRDLIRQAHGRGVKVFIDYNPWDRGTRREGRPDEEVLAELVADIEADGIFLDTMSASSTSLRQTIDKARPGVVLAPEGHPSIEQLSMLSASWAQWLHDPRPPGLLHLKWIEPRHMQHQIRRWDHTHQAEIEAAFFNGSGMLIWENIFGTHNPWPSGDRRMWRRAVGILRHFAAAFTSDRWDPFVPTLARRLFAHRWPAEGATVFTLRNLGEPIHDGALIQMSADSEAVYYDVWSGLPLRTQRADDGSVRLFGSIDRLGCVLAIEEARVDDALRSLLDRQRRIAAEQATRSDPRNAARSVIDPLPIARTKAVARGQAPPGMVFVPGATIRMKIEHMRRECGCYPDPGTPPATWRDFLWGSPHNGKIRHDIGPVELKPFFIDEAEVSNANYERFLKATGYQPKHRHNFLKHWPDGKIPDDLADHPVVYVDLDDARAYARWAGKRLPTEGEWHLAAQGTDGRTWPWGNAFDANRCNTTGDRTVPVRSQPTGRSPYGCYHMSGNVWEWTESVRDDGHTRFAMIRGGSYFSAKGSGWYVRGGPQPCDHHAKFLLMWPGLDRCATIGFRCVVDVRQ